MSVRGITYTETLDLVTEQCCNCGVVFAMPAGFRQQCVNRPGGVHRGGKSFYCPAGHQQYYDGDSPEVRERKRAERLEQQLASRDEDLRAERVSHAATKGQLTKTRRRVANGVCPCCQRTFKQLSRHMAGQHPEYVEASS